MIRSPGFLLRLFQRDAQDDTKYSELMQSKREGRLRELLANVKKGYIVNEVAIKERAGKLGYTLEEINKMLSDNPNETYDED